MAESFLNQVDALTGFSTTDSDPLSDWLTAGAAEIIKILPPDMIELASTTSDLDSSPNTLAMDSSIIGDIISVIRNDGTQYQICRKIPGFLSSRATISSDIMYATASDPVYYIKSSTLYIYPLPTDTYGAEVTHVHYPSVAHGDSAIDDFPNGCEYLVVLYASCKALQRLMNDKSSNLPSDVSEPVLSSVSTSLPSYTSPDSFVLPVLPAGVDVDFSEVGDIGVFVPPAVNLKELTYTSPVIDYLDWSDANNWISTEEDSEMLQARIAEIQAKIADFTANMQNAQAVFGKENADVQAKLNKYGTDIQNETARVGSSLSEYQAEVQKALTSYQAETGYDISKYSAEVQANVQKFNSDLQDNSTDFINNLQKYQAEIGKITETNQSKLGKYAQDLANYGAKIQKHSADYQWIHGQRELLMRDYNQGIQMLIGGGQSIPPQKQQQQGER